MILEINDTKSIADIQQEFRSWFPFLKIEFYDIPQRWRELSARRHRFAGNCTIGTIRNKQVHSVMELHASKKTGAVEQTFHQLFGLNVQIFRKQGEYWIRTAGTGDLTLGEQDEIGREATIDHRHLVWSVTQQENVL